jgi:hypothetical protein
LQSCRVLEQNGIKMETKELMPGISVVDANAPRSNRDWHQLIATLQALDGKRIDVDCAATGKDLASVRHSIHYASIKRGVKVKTRRAGQVLSVWLQGKREGCK